MALFWKFYDKNIKNIIKITIGTFITYSSITTITNYRNEMMLQKLIIEHNDKVKQGQLFNGKLTTICNNDSPNKILIISILKGFLVHHLYGIYLSSNVVVSTLTFEKLLINKSLNELIDFLTVGQFAFGQFAFGRKNTFDILGEKITNDFNNNLWVLNFQKKLTN